MTLGTLHLIRSSTSDVIEALWNLTHTADHVSDNWKGLLTFYKCLEMKSKMVIPPNPAEYVRNLRGMKIEARAIRYMYDVNKGVEVLKGASFVIQPGEMIAVVGYFPLI